MQRSSFISSETIEYYSNTSSNTEATAIQTKLEQESHIFIVCFGMFIGMIISLFIGYHLNPTLLNIFFLMSFPVFLTYCLRKIHIHTLIHYQE